MSKTVIIDGNAVGYAAHYATKLLSGDLQTQAIFGFIKTVRVLRTTYPDHKMVCLWDGKAAWRFDICPEYKSTRSNDPKKLAIRSAYTEQRPYIARAINHLGIRQITAFTHEADDLAGLLVKQLTTDKPDNEIVLITGDGDWIQLIRPNVTWRDLRDDSKIITMNNLMDKTGFATPFGFLEGKALQGDTSDDIPPVGGIGEKGAPLFIAEFGSVRKFWQAVESGSYVPTKKAHINLASAGGRMAYGRNFRMMQLLKVAVPAKESVQSIAGKLDVKAFSELCEELAFRSILRDVDNFCKPFEE